MSPPASGLSVLSLLLSLLSLSACSSADAPATPPAPGACAAGTAPDATGACVPMACTEAERLDPDTNACKALGWQACPAGFTADPSGHGCRDVLPDHDCPAGTMPVLGQTACQAVGPASCAAGFERDPSGWGCRAILPAASCAGATKETLGNATCAAVGDCSAAFPPAGAAVFVNAAFTGGQLDATHVKTIAEALAAAAAGAVIAVDAGTYTETIAATKPVRIVGRCPAEVTLAGWAGSATAGIAATSAIAVTVEGMTITGHRGAAIASGGATLTLRDSVIDANRGDSITVSGAGTHALIERSVIRATTAAAPGRGLGILTNASADLIVRDSAVADNVDTAILVAASGSHALVERSAILGTRSNASGDFGLGVMTRDGAKSEITATALSGNHEVAIFAYGTGSHATVTDVVVSDTLPSPGAGTGPGLMADTGALDAERVTVVRSSDVGVQSEHSGTLTAHALIVRDTQPGASGDNGLGVAAIGGSTASLTASALVDNVTIGASAIGPKAKLTLDGTLVTGTKADTAGGRGYGVELEMGAAADLKGSAVVGNLESGVFAVDASTSVTLAQSVVSSTKAGKGKAHGRGVVLEMGASASVSQSALIANHDIGASARNAGSSLKIEQTVIRGTLPQDSDGTHGRGLEADDGAKLSVSQSAVLGNHGVGILGSSKSVVDVRDSWIADTLADASTGGPGRAATAQASASMTLLGVVVQRSAQLALAASAGASLSVKGSLVEDTAAAQDGTFGHGVLADDGGLLVVDDVTITKSAGAALVFAASRGNVSHTRIRANAVGIHVQDGSVLQEVATVPDDPPDGTVNVSTDSTFDGNGSRVGSGALPLPAPLQ